MRVRNWKTTAGGITAAASVLVSTFDSLITSVDLTKITGTLLALGLALLGIGARDADVTSEGTKVKR